jgi:chromate reductase
MARLSTVPRRALLSLRLPALALALALALASAAADAASAAAAVDASGAAAAAAAPAAFSGRSGNADADENPVRIVAITGSLRARSTNTALLRYAAQVAPSLGAEVVLLDVALPLYSEDVEAAGLPAAVRAARGLAADADAVLLATTEYNYAMTPVTSNAIAWLSRGRSPIAGKPAALVSAGGGAGGLRAQMHARDSLQYLDMKMLNKPELALNNFDGSARFDETTGDLTDAATQERVKAVVAALALWARQLAKAGAV